MNDNEQRDELAAIYVDTLNRGHGVIDRPKQGERAADAILAAGYHKPRTICFVILDGDASPQARYATKAAAAEVRDAWVAAHESAGVPCNFRVAEIVEATR